MRTDAITKMLLCHIAVPTKHLQISRESLLDDPTPPIAGMDLLAVPFAVIVDMIECQKRHLRFAATCTLSPIVCQHEDAARPVVLGHTFSPSFFIVGMIEPLLMPFCAACTLSFNSRLPAPAEAFRITRFFSYSPFNFTDFTLSRAVPRKLFTARVASAFRLTRSAPLAPVFVGVLGHLRQRIKRAQSRVSVSRLVPLLVPLKTKPA